MCNIFNQTGFSLFPQNGEVDPAVKALEARQDEIMRKLYELKAAVEGLAKTVTTPDADLDLTVSSSLSPQSFSSTTFKGATDLDSLLGKVRYNNVCFFILMYLNQRLYFILRWISL